MDNYIKIKKIGEGSFGRALLVKRKSDGKQCVVKEIGIAKMPAKEREESKKEVKVLSQLKHPNIVNYLESFQGDGNLYIVMDYCEAGDLYQHIVKQRGIHLEESKVLDIFVQCCLAIKHIHDRKILHRDIKTQNIFLTRHYIVKLGDFGIARVLKSTMELARTCIGTPYYLSPEIVENRPYNNKSDIWSLGCVLYELATLKHAFEAGSMKNLVLKIVRGSYPPVPSRYSFELRSLVAQCFKRSPSERPSINSILKKPIIQQRISKYLSPEEVETEFSHTVLHREKFNMMTPVSRPSSVAKKPPAGKRLAGPAAVYGVSVAKKPMPLRKPLGMIQADARQKRISGQNVKVASEKRKEIYARERRRKDLVLQEQQYQEYMAKIQKQRWEKQQAAHISRAREAGWKSVLSTDEKKLKAEIHDVDIVKNRSPMKKYQAQNEEKVKEEKKELHAEEKPVVKPVNAWSEDVKGFKAEDAAERGRVLEEFWQRKKEAAEYKARGHQDIYGGRKKDQETNPLLQFHNQQMAAQRNEKEVAYPAARNKQEVDYLKQLEEIRKQNYIERKVIQGPPGRLIVQRNERVPDPRYDPDARKKKIEALKEQAEQRSKMLRQQLEARKKQVEERMMREQQQRLLQKKNAEKQLTERPLPLLKEQQEKNEKFATPSVGLETAMNQVNHPKLFRSCSEGDLSELVKPVEKAQRKNWGDFAPVALALVHMPLEITSSAMEATVADVESSDESRSNVQVRKHWIPDGRTQLVSMLHNIELSGTQMPTVTMKNDNNSLPPSNLPPTGSGAQKGDTITLSPKSNTALPGDTITISPKRNTTEAGRTVVIARSDISCINDSEIPIASAKLEMSTNSETIALKQKKKNDEAKLSVSLEETPERRTNNEEKIDNNEAKIDENEGKIYIDEMNQEKNEDVNDKNEDIIDISANETRTEVEASPKIAWCAEPVDEADSVNVESCGDVKEEEEEKEEDSFHTPNRVVELQTGCYDIEKKLLRTCSLPDLRNETNFREPVAASLHGERSIKSSGERRSLINNDDVNVEDVDDLCADGRDKDDDHQSDSEAVDEEYLDSEEEEFEDFESMLESMRDVLKSTAHSPSSTVLPQVTSDAAGKICSHVSNKRTDDDVEEDGDVWESEDGEEDEKTTKQTDAKLKETLFSRIEESRKVLEDELGLELFLKIYRHVQDLGRADFDETTFPYFTKSTKSIQDNEDDELELGTTEISHLLGDKEYLYQKILYLVMADTAYCEGNDGIC